MSTLPDPQPDGRPRTITAGERAVLDDLAGHENAADPGFVLRMNAPPRVDAAGTVEDIGGASGPGSITRAHTEALGRARRRRAVQAVVLGGLLGLLLPPAWFLAGLLTVVLFAVPTVLVLTALRTTRRSDPPTDPR